MHRIIVIPIILPLRATYLNGSSNTKWTAGFNSVCRTAALCPVSAFATRLFLGIWLQKRGEGEAEGKPTKNHIGVSPNGCGRSAYVVGYGNPLRYGHDDTNNIGKPTSNPMKRGIVRGALISDCVCYENTVEFVHSGDAQGLRRFLCCRAMPLLS